MENYLGIDIGGTFIKYGIINNIGKVISKGKTSTDRQNPKVVIAKLIEIIEQGKIAYEIKNVGISLPGVIDQENKMLTSGAIESLYKFDIVGILEKETNVNIKLSNDANAIAVAEKWIGAGKGCKNFVCLPLGTGVGGAIVIDGKIIKGRVGAAGEFGMTLMGLGKKEPLRYESASFYCGSIAGLCRSYNLKLGKKDLSEWEYSVEAIMEEASKGNEVAISSLSEFYNNIAVLLLNISTVIDPELILVGGGICENEIVMMNIINSFNLLRDRYTDISALGAPIIKKCQLGNTAGMLGAVVPYLDI